jgi:quinol monooxygenase YgiN
MIMITGTVVGAPESRPAFLAAAMRQVTGSRAEAGRLGYSRNEDVMAQKTFSWSGGRSRAPMWPRQCRSRALTNSV